MLIKILGVILSDGHLEFPLPVGDYFMIGLRCRGKIIGLIDPLLMKVHMYLGHPLVIKTDPLLAFHLCLPGPVTVQVKIIVIGSATGPGLTVFTGHSLRIEIFSGY